MKFEDYGYSEQDVQRAHLWIQFWLNFFDQVRANQKPGAEPIESYFGPPASPENELPAAEDAEFGAGCRADMAAMTNGDIKWETQLFTRSERWGLIWRADFWRPQRDQLHPTRVVCWKTDEGRLGTVLSHRENKKLELNL